jgi:hypothetical protein
LREEVVQRLDTYEDKTLDLPEKKHGTVI